CSGVVAQCCFFFSSRRRHTSWPRDWSSDVCSSDLKGELGLAGTSSPLLQGVLRGGRCSRSRHMPSVGYRSDHGNGFARARPGLRSEERRVGKECSARLSACPEDEKETETKGCITWS